MKRKTRRKRSRERRKKSKKEKYVDAEKLLDEYLDEVEVGLGLSHLNLDKDLLKEAIKEPFVAAVGQVKTKPKARTILNRLNSSKDELMEFMAIRIIREVDVAKVTDDILEFLIMNTRKAVVDLAPTLYSEAKKRGRRDLVDVLRYNWNLYGLRSPVKCPQCEFEAVMPDLVCKVCGYSVSFKEIKNSTNLISQLEEMFTYDPEGLKEILTAGYLIYTSTGPMPPSRFKPSGMEIYYEIVLTSQERAQLNKLYNIQI
ncbi:hypothetical protein [Metallosphaera hakonensis]|uniref:hypothetical protein n=1 Tax=Metallosphaera hakonensis TaxID=79601 RepID=UPI0006D1A99A|nr:hypothetical protein [Metallosphaera hakonensis]